MDKAILKRKALRVAFLTLLVASVGCESGRAGSNAADTSVPGHSFLRRPGAPCDSTLAADIALDSVDRTMPFRSSVHVFEQDSTGIRIVTYPVQSEKIIVTDGGGMVRLNVKCEITSVVFGDSI